jgi:hypothetical protein
MTRKQYRTAMGKTVDMGALMLQNEGIRAVGNMSVNARGDRLNSTNKVIDKKTQQIKRQNRKHVQSEQIPTATSNAALKKPSQQEMKVDPTDSFLDLPSDEVDEVVEKTSNIVPDGGLAAAIAKAKTVQQTKLPTPRELSKASGVKKI